MLALSHHGTPPRNQNTEIFETLVQNCMTFEYYITDIMYVITITML